MFGRVDLTAEGRIRFNGADPAQVPARDAAWARALIVSSRIGMSPS
jgi:hypothetical protein